MDALTAQNYGFHLYFKLLTLYQEGVGTLLIYNEDSQLIWQSQPIDSRKLTELAQVIPTFDSVESSGSDTSPHSAGIVDQAYDMIRLRGIHNRIIITLAVERKDRTDSTGSIFEAEAVSLLNQGLLEWHRASLRFASQEDELNSMTDELTRRYEELNLIYKADDQAHNIFHGRDLLMQLVQNAPGIINVDLAVLALPGKDLTIYKCKNDKQIPDSELLIKCVRENVFNQLADTELSVVVNHEEDARRNNLTICLPHKLTASPLVNAEGEVIGVFAMLKKSSYPDFDNSDRNLLEVLANKASKIVQYNFDPLTGLENSSSFELILTEALKKTTKFNSRHVVAYVDIDGMSIVNDISGREGGDRLIKQVGQKIAGMIRSGDTVARLGGDKFGVYLQDCDLIRGKAVMQKIADEISQIKFEWENKLHEVSISVGIAPINSASRSITTVMKAAESARAQGKQIGPNRVSIFETDKNDLIDMKDQVHWLGRIQASLKADSYVLYSQLIEPNNSANGKPHYEVLIRMLDDDKGILLPETFLPAAEKYQLMPKIDRWVISHSLATLNEVFDGNERALCPISINLSGQSLSDPVSLGDFIEEQLKHYSIEPSLICFEVTESSAITNLEAANQFIDRMHSLGCEFSLDDFGTGLSSFAYLKDMKVDYLKIDGSFVRNILSDTVSESMVSAINQVGHAMGLCTVAEFVENQGIRDKLNEIGVDFSQGYHLGKPIELQKQLKMVLDNYKQASGKSLS